MAHSVKYNFFMSQLTVIEDLKETEKTKISVVYHTGLKASCILRVCKNRDLSSVCTALRKIRNPNTVVVHDYVYEDGDTYILEENVDGSTIEELLYESETFSEKHTAEIIIEVCKALEQLHSEKPPIVHNDINPSNIKIREDGSVKLFDFDISRTYKKGQTQNTTLLGTEEYASPEHFGFGQSEPRTDIYCLGVTMHKMLTGCGLSPEHQVTYGGPLKSIISKCTEPNPKNRYSSVVALKKDLEKFLIRKRNVLHTMLGVLLAGIVVCSSMFVIGQFDAQNDKISAGTASGQPTNGAGTSTTGESQDNLVDPSAEGTTSNNETTVPIETPPADEVSKSYVDTLAPLPQSVDEMVFTKAGIIFYLKDNKLFALENGSTTQLFDGETDYYEEITEPDMINRLKEDPNYWSGLDDEDFIDPEGIIYFDKLYLSNLGYNEENDTVYVSGSTNVDSAARMFVWNQLVFAVPNMENAVKSFACATLDGSVNKQSVVATEIIYTNKTIAWRKPYSQQILEIDPIHGTTISYESSFYDSHPAFNFNFEYLYLEGARYEFGYGLFAYGGVNKYDIAQNTWVSVSLADDGIDKATAFCVYNNRIYYATHLGVFYLEPSGTNRFKSVNVLSWQDLDIKDGAPVGEISQFLFDDNGNIIFSDDTQHRLRKIFIS